MTFDHAACSVHIKDMTPWDLAKNLRLACKYCAELEADLRQSELVIRAKMDAIEELQAEGKKALEHIDDQAAIIRNLRERLATEEAPAFCPVSEICRNPGKCPECMEASR